MLENRPYGLVVCGGQSARMGTDKSSLVYHIKPQRYHLYNLLESVCGKAFISCNKTQASGIDKNYHTIIDADSFSDIGPMAALLTAFAKYPQNDFLMIGCDYPFITQKDIALFLDNCTPRKLAHAFFNEKENLYEPLLAWYSHKAAAILMDMFQKGQHSLQWFLRVHEAGKFFSENKTAIISVDTPAAYQEAITLLK